MKLYSFKRCRVTKGPAKLFRLIDIKVVRISVSKKANEMERVVRQSLVYGTGKDVKD
jgi:hypothetical protein